MLPYVTSCCLAVQMKHHVALTGQFASLQRLAPTATAVAAQCPGKDSSSDSSLPEVLSQRPPVIRGVSVTRISSTALEERWEFRL
jgi:hypothetical protein